MEYLVYFNGREIAVTADSAEWLPDGDLIFRSGPAKEIVGRFIAGNVQGCLSIQDEPRFVKDAEVRLKLALGLSDA